MGNIIVKATGELVSETFGTLEQEQEIKVNLIKREAREIIFDLEGENNRLKAQEQDAMNGGFRYQRLIHEIELVRQRSNDLKAQVLALTEPREVVELEYLAPLNAPLEIGDVPAVLTKRQFQGLVVTVFELGKLGGVINAAEAVMTANNAVRDVIEAYREAQDMDKQVAQNLIGVLISEGVEGFTQDDLTAVLIAWPTL
jgi:hypothetical protein